MSAAAVERCLQGILRRQDKARAVLFDLAEVVAAVQPGLGDDERLTTAAGSFFDQVPAGADTYILSRILHDWPDEQCHDILTACRAAMDGEAGARLLILERLLGGADAGSGPSAASLWDLQMPLPSPAVGSAPSRSTRACWQRRVSNWPGSGTCALASDF